MKISTSEFLRAALPALKFPGSNPLVPIMGAVLISPIENDSEFVTVTAATGEGFVRVKAPVKQPPVAPICVSAEDLLKILKMTYGEATLKVDGNTAKYSCGTVKVNIPAETAKGFPSADTYSDNIALSAKTSEVEAVLSKMSKLGADWDMKPGLSGLFFYGDKVATVDPQAVHYVARTTLPSPAAFDFVIPHRCVPKILSLLSVEDPLEDNEVHICVADNRNITVATEHGEVNLLPNAAKEFTKGADFDNKFNLVGTDPYEFSCSPELLKSAVVRAAAFGANHVQIAFGMKECVITGKGNVHSPDLPGYKIVSETVPVSCSGERTMSFAVKTLLEGLNAMEGQIKGFVGEQFLLLDDGKTSYIQSHITT